MKSQLHDFVTAFGDARDPQEAGEVILSAAISSLAANRGRLYLFDLASGSYQSFANQGRSEQSSPVPHPAKMGNTQRIPTIERAIAVGSPVFAGGRTQHADSLGREGTYVNRVVIPVSRHGGGCVIGVVDVDGAGEREFLSAKRRLPSQLSAMASMIPHIYSWRFRQILLQQIQQPINFDQGLNEFYRDISQNVALTSQMEFTALREFDATGGALRTIFQEGLPVERSDLASLDIDVQELSAFATALTSERPVPRFSMEGPGEVGLTMRPELKDVRSFVACPVLVGDSIFGVLSFASSVKYEYSDDEMSALQSVANNVGLAISNYRNHHEARERATEFAGVATAITAMEVAQAARHEARGILDDVSGYLLLAKGAASAKPWDFEKLGTQLDRIDDKVVALNDVLDKIKAASRAPAVQKKPESLEKIWREAQQQVAGRLATARVERVDFVGKDVVVYVSRDWFRQVFLNLLLNSCDAFLSDASNKRGRRIALHVESSSERSSEIELRYVDNAGGINFSALRNVADGQPILDDPESALFRRDVSSKKEGSGWGLYLVRRILRMHGGSINLVDHRRGVVFGISLPNALPQAKEFK